MFCGISMTALKSGKKEIKEEQDGFFEEKERRSGKGIGLVNSRGVSDER